jgi:hypothetical protein
LQLSQEELKLQFLNYPTGNRSNLTVFVHADATREDILQHVAQAQELSPGEAEHLRYCHGSVLWPQFLALPCDGLLGRAQARSVVQFLAAG